jgi:UDP-N-acetylmuramoyl-tripeptide--D-alanyl-D-alanine ligase
MRTWTAEQIAGAAQAELVSASRAPAGASPNGPASAIAGPERVTINSRDAGPGALFVGLPGARTDGGAYAPQALDAGAWGVLVAPAFAGGGGTVLVSEDPLRSLQRLATAWRRALDARVIAVTGSTGKTSTKDLIAAVLAPHLATVASRANFNTEIGLPIEILNAPEGTQALVLEMGMRGAGQIAELAEIAEPDVGVIVSVGAAHVEQLGSIEGVAAAKAELIAALEPGATAIVPAGEALLAPHLREDLETVTFGEGGDVRLIGGDERRVEIDLAGERLELGVNFTQAHLRYDLLAAVAAARAIGVTASGDIELSSAPGRGQRFALAGDVTLIDDCYNANPLSVAAALEDLAVTAAATPGSRSVAVLGDMLELGALSHELHAEVGAQATRAGVELLVTVGPLAEAIAERYDGETLHTRDSTAAAEVVAPLIRPGDVVLVKGSRGVRLERVCEALQARRAEVRS